jgi:hypothetical protein
VLAGWCLLSGLSVEEIEASRHCHSSDLHAEFAVTLARKVAVTHADVSESDMSTRHEVGYYLSADCRDRA